MHNRLTHSEKVAQVSRSIAEHLISDEGQWSLLARLGGLDVDVCEAAGLAHDLGHPPFGHVGEKVLDELARELLELPDGFEGNAQSFRIVSQGKIRSIHYEGLDLTAATLAAIAKYPWTRTPTMKEPYHSEKIASDADYRRQWTKFNAYEAQSTLLDSCRKFSLVGSETQTLEASVMDVADDITYAIHDLEDFYLGGILDVSSIRADLASFRGEGRKPKTPFLDLQNRLKRDYPDYFDEGQLGDAAKYVDFRLKKGLGGRNSDFYEKEPQARSMGSSLIQRYINRVVVRPQPLWGHGPHIGLDQSAWHEIQLWKEITKRYVIQRPDIALLQRGQEAILTGLVEILSKWVGDGSGRTTGRRDLLPARLKEEVEIADALAATEGKRATTGYGLDQHAPRGSASRAILDYLCTLTDVQCTVLYHNLSGTRVHRVSLGGVF